MTAGASYLLYINTKMVHKEELEMRSGDFAIFPLLLAERDRAYLKQLRKNRDEEGRLMANVEGWKVGTWYGESIYETRPKDELVGPMYGEYYVHADLKEFKKRAYLSLYS